MKALRPLVAFLFSIPVTFLLADTRGERPWTTASRKAYETVWESSTFRTNPVT